MTDNNETLYTLADIKDYFRGCRDNATGTARKRFEKYIGAVESAMRRYDSTRYVPVTRCYECQHWEPECVEEDDSCGHCRNRYCPCQNQQTDMNWFCADGERR